MYGRLAQLYSEQDWTGIIASQVFPHTGTTSTYQRHGVDGADDHGRQPEGDDGAAAVQEDGGLVLNGVPLPVKIQRHRGEVNKACALPDGEEIHVDLWTAGNWHGTHLCLEVLEELVAGGRCVLGRGLRTEQGEPRCICNAAGIPKARVNPLKRRQTSNLMRRTNYVPWRRSWQTLRRGRRAERGAAGRLAPPRSATEYAVAAMLVGAPAAHSYRYG